MRISLRYLIKNGGSDSVIKRLGGWKTDIFFTRYRNVGSDELKGALDIIDYDQPRIFSSECSTRQCPKIEKKLSKKKYVLVFSVYLKH